MVVRGDVMDQQIEDLRERMHLLQQDRRANVDLLQANKVAIAEEMRSLRDENKELRIQLTKLKKETGESRGDEQELSGLQKDVFRLRSEYDSLKVFSFKRKSQLDKLKDDAKLCELEAKRPSQEDSPLSQQIRILENRLDKAMIKYNEAQSIRNTYEHIARRLKEERISFDNQLSALERTLNSKKRDYEELLLLSGNANHARELAQHELQRAQQNYEEKRLKREADIRERHQVVKVRKQMLERKERRELKLQEIANRELNHSDSELRNAAISSRNVRIDDEATEDQERKIDFFESAFRKIKEATGVSDVNEVIQKIIGQECTTENLVALTKQNQARIEELAGTREKMKKTVEEVKYSGSSSGYGRKTVDDKEEELADSLSDIERCKSKYERLTTTLISITAGVNHLKDKVEIVREEVGIGNVYHTNTDSTIVDALRASRNVLIELLRRINEKYDTDLSLEEDDSRHRLLSCDSFDAIDSLSEEEVQENRPFNQRVRLPSAKDKSAFEHDSVYDNGFDELDEEELSRERVKKVSSQIVQAQERKKTRQRRRN